MKPTRLGLFKQYLGRVALGAVCAAWLLVPAAQQAQGATISFQDGLNGYAGTADTQLRAGGATTDYSATDPLNVDRDDSGIVQGLVKFNNIFGNGANQIPPGTMIVSAQLILRSTANNANSPGPIHVHRVITPWQENTTWSTSPGADGYQTNDVEAAAIQDAQFIPSSTNPSGNLANTWQRAVDVTATVQLWSNNPDSNQGWLLINDNTDGYRFDSSETTTITNRPRLEIVYGNPDPAGFSVSPVSTNIPACKTLRFSVTATGTPPITIQWYKDGGLLSETIFATAPATTNIVIPNVTTANAGTYYAVAANPAGNYAQSDMAVVNVLDDNTPPTVVSAFAEANLTNFVVSFSEPINPSMIGDALTYTIYPSAGGAPFTLMPPVLRDETNIVLSIDTLYSNPREANVGYTLQIVSEMTIGEACNPNLYVAPTTVPIKFSVVLANWDKTWKYNADGTDLGTAWYAPGYNDSAWASGPGIFDGHTSGPRATAGGIATGTGLPVNTTAGTYATNRIPTFYFRTHFSISGDPATTVLSLRHLFDDAGIIYLNGFEVARVNITDGIAAPFTNYSGTLGQTAAVDSAAIRGPIEIRDHIVAGDNVIAVEVKQINATSSDVDMGLEVSALVSENPCTQVAFSVQPQATIVAEEGENVTISASVTGFQPQYQWTKDNIDIAGANSSALVLSNVTAATAGSYRVRVWNECTLTAKVSSPAVVTVTPDLSLPFVKSATVNIDDQTILVSFTKTNAVAAWALDTTTAQNNANYSLSPAVTINSAVVVNGTNVVLNTAPRNPTTEYTLTVRNVKDNTYTRNTMTPNPTVIPLVGQIRLFGLTGDWKYDANASDFGTAWKEVGFDDSAWPSGTAAFGLESGNPLTFLTAQFPPAGINTPLTINNSSGVYVTNFFFRKKFNATVTDLSAVTLTFRGYVDDGAVFYLNGQEVGRFNMPSGTITATTGAAGTMTEASSATAGGTAWFTTNLNTAPLLNGENTFAVSVAQSGTGSSDIVFGGELLMEVIPCVPAAFSVQPPATVSGNEGGNVTISATVTGQAPTYQWTKDNVDIAGATSATLTLSNLTQASAGSYRLRVQNRCTTPITSSAAVLTVVRDLSQPVVESAIAQPDSQAILVTFAKTNAGWALNAATAQSIANYSLTPSVTVLSAVVTNGTSVILTTAARTPNTKYTLNIKDVKDNTETGNLIAPNPTTINVTEQVRVVSFGSTWKYDGSGTDLGTAWRNAGYNDAGWPTGTGAFGWEDSSNSLVFLRQVFPPNGINTTIPLTNSAGTRVITYYFRTAFNNPLADFTGAKLLFTGYVDDGAVFYINGQEAARFLMTNNPVLFNTLADDAGDEPNPAPRQTWITTNLVGLAAGANTVAVEVHQNSATSSDIAFGGELVIQYVPAGGAGSSLTVTRNPDTGAVSLSWTGSGTLVESTAVTGPYNPSANQANPQTITPGAQNKFYRVRTP